MSKISQYWRVGREVRHGSAKPSRRERYSYAPPGIFNTATCKLVYARSLCYYPRMSKRRSWSDGQLQVAVAKSRSYRAVLIELKLIPAGGNYAQITSRIKSLNLDTSHFTGKGWNVGMQFRPTPPKPIEELLVAGSAYQSHRLKKRLFLSGLKKPACELCGWSQESPDGRIPVELDHVNGDHSDNRIENLRILCPNCHSLQPTHRGRNKKVRLRYARVS